MSAATATAPPSRRTAGDVELDATRARSVGLNVAVGMVIVCSVGMAVTFNDRMIVDPVLSMGWLALALLPLLGGYLVAGREQLEGVASAAPGGTDVARAALSGAWAGGAFALFVVVLDAFGDGLRDVFVQLSPQLLAFLTFDRGLVTGIVAALAVAVAAAAIGGAVRIAPGPARRSLVQAMAWVAGVSVLEAVVEGMVDELDSRAITEWFPGEAVLDFLYAGSSGLTVVGAVTVAVVAAGASAGVRLLQRRGAARRRRGEGSDLLASKQSRIYAGLFVAALILPWIFNRSVNDLLINVVIFGIMAIGLNIVIGLTGMLDLGYVAFFAVGAYTTAVLTAPASNLAFSPELSFWLALPIALVVAVVAGIIIGTPVIRLRGDYLAIVTLGFAAIAQVLVLSDWFAPVLGGPQGVRDVPPVPLGVAEVSATVEPRGFLWFSLALLAVMIYIAWRLQHSRLGRAWQAIREDETVAEAMGIDVGAMKLLSFCVGAVFAALAGGLFAAKVSSSFPTSFELLVSVLVLVVVIVGGTGYVPGVLLGSLVLVGVLGGPTTQGLLAEFAQYKLLIYGALLVVMMLAKPEGLLPKPDREREVAQEEMDQDAWFDKNVGGSSAVSTAGDATGQHRADAAGDVAIETELQPDEAAPARDHDTMQPGDTETTISTDPGEGEA